MIAREIVRTHMGMKKKTYDHIHKLIKSGLLSGAEWLQRVLEVVWASLQSKQSGPYRLYV